MKSGKRRPNVKPAIESSNRQTFALARRRFWFVNMSCRRVALPHKRPFRASLAEWKSNFSCSNSCADAPTQKELRVPKEDQVAARSAALLPFPARSPDLHTNATVVAQNGQTRAYKVSARARSFTCFAIEGSVVAPQAAYPSSIWLFFLQIRR